MCAKVSASIMKADRFSLSNWMLEFIDLDPVLEFKWTMLHADR